MIEMSGIRINSSRVASLVLLIWVLVVASSPRVWCVDEDDYSKSGNPKVLPLVTSLIYNQILNLTQIFNKEITGSLGYCTKDVDADLNGAFKFSNNLDFLSNCVKETKDVTKRICTAAEMKFYFSSFMDTKSADAQFLKPNRNCNLTSWVPGCEPGWACTIPQNAQVDLKNSKDIPDRTRDSQPCCGGFFCPRGLTCMIPCPLGSYCPRAKLNKSTGLCEPYAYQLPPGKTNHSCGGADVWAGVSSSDEIFCSAGSYCPTTTQRFNASKGIHYCRQGSTEQRACFKLSTCNPNSDTQNLHAYGFMLIIGQVQRKSSKKRPGNCTSKTKVEICKRCCKKRAVGLQQQLSRTFSRKTGDASLPPRFPSNSSTPPSGAPKTKKEAGNLTKMLQSFEDNPDSHKGFDMAIGDKNIKKQMPKAKQLHTKSQIFKYAYGQLEKEKAMEQKQQNLTFSGVISMATDTDMKTRPTIEVAFKDLTITLKKQKQTSDEAFAGKIRGCIISGSILINGRPDSIHCYKKIVGFVPQDDIVHGNLTVEENLRFSARCRLSAEMPKADKVLVVERVIESLGLQAVRDSLVGNSRKASSSSNLLIRALRREALEGVNICMVVHQPRKTRELKLREGNGREPENQNTNYFGTLGKSVSNYTRVAIKWEFPEAKGGLTVYHGPVKKVEEYFASFGINVPERVNPPDHFIDILEGIVKPSAGLTVEQLPVRWMLHNGYPVPPDMLHYCDEIASASKGVMHGRIIKSIHSSIFLKTHDLSNRHTPGLIRQYRYFLGRNGKQRLREAQLQAADYLILLLAGACLGTLSKVKGDTFGYYGYMYTVISVSLLCKISALRSFSLDKLHYRRESESGMSSLAYFLSKDTVDHFNTLIKPLVFLSMFYSFSNPRSTFVENYIVLLCLVYCVTGIAYMFAIFLQPGRHFLPPSIQWCVLLPVVLTLIANQGKEDKVGKLLSAYCYPTWALEAFLIANAQRYSGVWLITRCAALNDFGYDVHHWIFCLVYLIVSGISFRFLAFFCLLKFGNK
ncbi:hypothetical protein Pfo_028765 [Paulownia fortunei]|nr:hypothetical protein Pfo_028765 [Paulownia fortunei]